MPRSYDTWEPAFDRHLRQDPTSACAHEGSVMRDVWHRERRIEFARYLFHGRFAALDALRERTRRVAPVKAILDGYLNLPPMLSSGYSTELLKISDGFFVEYER